jgi:hypothetical protein
LTVDNPTLFFRVMKVSNHIDPAAQVSGKYRRGDYIAITAYAQSMVSNRMEIVSAMRFMFDAATPRRRREALQRTRLRFPARQPRMGRGNKIPA